MFKFHLVDRITLGSLVSLECFLTCGHYFQIEHLRRSRPREASTEEVFGPCKVCFGCQASVFCCSFDSCHPNLLSTAQLQNEVRLSSRCEIRLCLLQEASFPVTNSKSATSLAKKCTKTTNSTLDGGGLRTLEDLTDYYQEHAMNGPI